MIFHQIWRFMRYRRYLQNPSPFGTRTRPECPRDASFYASVTSLWRTRLWPSKHLKFSFETTPRRSLTKIWLRPSFRQEQTKILARFQRLPSLRHALERLCQRVFRNLLVVCAATHILQCFQRSPPAAKTLRKPLIFKMWTGNPPPQRHIMKTLVNTS